MFEDAGSSEKIHLDSLSQERELPYSTRVKVVTKGLTTVESLHNHRTIEKAKRATVPYLCVLCFISLENPTYHRLHSHFLTSQNPINERNERSLGCMQWHHPTQKNQLPTTLGFIQPLMKLPKAISCNKLLLKRVDVPELKFSLYFLGYEDVSKAPSDPVDRTAWTFGKPATIELTHNWGTESDPEFKGYHNGNSEPRGFGHIGITVDDAIKACERFERLGVEFVKKLDAGKMRGIAFIKDPDDFRKRGWHMKVYLNVLVSEYALP
ncbi:hypothetical protein V6N11_031065 [Hibiscus sabdariffa]|uniref:Uncharacterized protein n=2 Tax=Hibiscus sabdariffa TaxID=183260 RepID=A0ABR2CMP6_9ROSI